MIVSTQVRIRSCTSGLVVVDAVSVASLEVEEGYEEEKEEEEVEEEMLFLEEVEE